MGMAEKLALYECIDCGTPLSRRKRRCVKCQLERRMWIDNERRAVKRRELKKEAMK